jgi:hypothetical protein
VLEENGIGLKGKEFSPFFICNNYDKRRNREIQSGKIF